MAWVCAAPLRVLPHVLGLPAAVSVPWSVGPSQRRWGVSSFLPKEPRGFLTAGTEVEPSPGRRVGVAARSPFPQ